MLICGAELLVELPLHYPYTMVNHLPQHTVVSLPNDANQEKVAPSANPLANLQSTAREALAAHINRSAKGKRRAGTYAPRVARPYVFVFQCIVVFQ